MTYLLEGLGDERFQQLCQALVLLEFPSAQCLPVGQPDGGRDSFVRSRADTPSLHVFQMKFTRSPASKVAREEVIALIRGEKEKVSRLREKGLVRYTLLTNISGTSHLGIGSVDRADEVISNELGVDGEVWWRDDLERRIDSNSDIKWSYPEIIRAQDLMQVLFNLGENKAKTRRANALKAHIAAQYEEEKLVKFKQIELQNNIFDLFVDVPTIVNSSLESISTRMVVAQLAAERGSPSDGQSMFHRGDETVGASDALLSEGVARQLPRIVIEGAPGQGKSTITQYVCQVNRARLLGELGDISRIYPHHRACSLRIPLRVDLRDYAIWVTGRNPFSRDSEPDDRAKRNPSLETFLAAQISQNSGGNEFTVDDLVETAKEGPVVVALDGFDEVADIPTRVEVVQQISRAAIRLQSVAKSLQIIVTSRPSAFANSPGFPPETWCHLDLQSLTAPIIEQYIERWMRAKGLNEREKRDFGRAVKEKLEQSHMRDLARNPMQLAILLSLMRAQGPSLPDKRTALYGNYIEHFFNREAEKSEIIRTYRDLIIDIHGFLAWLLHAEAETAKGGGGISADRLKEVLSKYLELNRQPVELVDKLFQSLTERVVAIVSRVQGTYEFEVQPLREYFAARHLYETAPYSPTGFEKAGTLPDRFAALSRNFYWLNVTRFYAGFYNRGELDSLLRSLEDLAASAPFAAIAHPRTVCMTLLSDWVFTQQPITVQEVIDLILEEPGWSIYLSQYYSVSRSDTPSLPDRCGREALVDSIKREYPSASWDRRSILSRILSNNTDIADRMSWWNGSRSLYLDDASWLEAAGPLGIIAAMDKSELKELVHKSAEFHFLMIAHGRIDIAIDSTVTFDSLVGDIVDGNSGGYFHPYRRLTSDADPGGLFWLGLFFSPFIREIVYSTRNDIPALSMVDYMPAGEGVDRSSSMPDGIEFSESFKKTKQFNNLFLRWLSAPVSAWRASEPWSALVEEARKLWGERWGVVRVALLASVISEEDPKGAAQLVSVSEPLMMRIQFAKARAADPKYWADQVLSSTEKHQEVFIAAACMCLATPGVLADIAEAVADLLDGMTNEEFAKVISCASEFGAQQGALAERRGQKVRSGLTSGIRARLTRESGVSPRWATLLANRYPTVAMRIYEVTLQQYAGDDEIVLANCAAWSIEWATDHPRAWPRTLEVLRRAHEGAVFRTPRAWLRQEKEQLVPTEFALEVCSEPVAFPLRVVSACERSLRADAGRHVRPVGDVAHGENWF